MTASATPASTPEEPRSPLRRVVFRNLWIANLASGIGTTMNDTAVVWLMSQQTSSALLVSLVATAAALPLFLFSLPAGVVADLVDRRKFVIGAQAAMMGVATLLTGLAAIGIAHPVVLLTATFLLGTGMALTQPAWISFMPDLVPKPEMPAAVALGSVSLNISRAVGPALAGLIIGFGGAPWAFLLNALSFVGILGVLIAWKPEPKPRPKHPEAFIGAIVAAARYALHTRPLQAVLIRNMFLSVFGGAMLALLPVIAGQRLRLDAGQFGLLMTAFGTGAILSALFLLPRLRKKFSPDQLLNSASLGVAFMMIGLGFANSLEWVWALAFVGGIFWIAGFTSLNVAGQMALPGWARGRMNSVYLTVMQGSLALSGLLWGQTANVLGLPTALGAAGVGLALSVIVLGARFRLAEAHAAKLDPAPPIFVHEFPSLPKPDDGPVLVTVRYDVPTENRREFLSRMEEQREFRLRDGAFRWFLYESLEHPGQLEELFVVVSWSEHERQHERMPAGDAELQHRLLALTREGRGKDVRHYLRTDPARMEKL